MIFKANTSRDIDQRALQMQHDIRKGISPVYALMKRCGVTVQDLAMMTNIPASRVATMTRDVNDAQPEQIIAACRACQYHVAELAAGLVDITMQQTVMEALLLVAKDQNAHAYERSACIEVLMNYVHYTRYVVVHDESITTGQVQDILAQDQPNLVFNAPCRESEMTLNNARQHVFNAKSQLAENLGWQMFEMTRDGQLNEEDRLAYKGLELRIGLVAAWYHSSERLAQCCYIVNTLDFDAITMELSRKTMPQSHWLKSVLRRLQRS